jgi:hypothetical protein
MRDMRRGQHQRKKIETFNTLEGIEIVIEWTQQREEWDEPWSNVGEPELLMYDGIAFRPLP